MKRIFSTVLVAAMLVTLTSCFRKINDEIPETDSAIVSDTSSLDAENGEFVTDTSADTVETDPATEGEPDGDAAGDPPAYADPIYAPPKDDPVPAEPSVPVVPSVPAGNKPEISAPINDKSETAPLDPPLCENMEVDPNRKNYDMGICRELEGEVDVYLFFMDDNESSWTSSRADGFTHNEIDPALDFLERQAKKWGKSLHFNTPITYVTGGDRGCTMKYNGTVTRDLNITGSTKDVLEQAAKCIGYSDEYGMFNHYRKETGRDNAIYLTLLNKDGISYTRNQTNAKDIMYAEHCVLFSEPSMDKYGGIVSMRSPTVAHEILHLYGAEDYYNEPRLSIANELYLNDIMLLEYRNIWINAVGDYTAFSIGWTDVVPEVCSREGWLN